MKKLIVLSVCVMLFLAACAPTPTLAPTAVPAPTQPPTGISITSPKEGETVSNPVTVKVQVNGLTLIPAATPSAAGQGHLHVIVDGEPLAVGAVVPRNDTNIHFGTGASDLLLPAPLTAGKHKLVIMFTDSNHTVPNPPIVATVNIVVP